MSWPNNVASALVVIGAIVIAAGGAAGFAILVQIFRQGGLRLVGPSIIQGRWRMIRPWLLFGAVIGLLSGIGIVVLSRDRTLPAAGQSTIQQTVPVPPDNVKPQPTERLTRPRDGG